MAAGASSLPDSWNQPHIPSTSRHRAAAQARVPDDWDDDDDDEPVSEEANKRIWEDAYANLLPDNLL
ncbi:hypothetical protein C0993_011894 [Termitomyces sp. T159_Od127]|nr:hypothetical protein C0993_011894 [Termitomyces sp. T159_Od127]